MATMCTLLLITLFELWCWPVPTAGASVPENWPEVDFSRAPLDLRLGFGYQAGIIPPFRAGERDRSRLWAGASWQPVPLVVLDALLDGRADWYPDGTSQVGPGDLELSTTLCLVLWGTPCDSAGASDLQQHVVSGVSAGSALPGSMASGIGWSVKLPNASSENELGTDETDITILAVLAWSKGRYRVQIVSGLAVLGDPLRFSAQDDEPFVVGRLGIPRPQGLIPGLDLWAAYAARTTRNPARSELGLDLGWGRLPAFWLRGAVGTSPAAPDWSVSFWWRASLASGGDSG